MSNKTRTFTLSNQNNMNSLVITDGTNFITNRFGKVQLTDNINIANTYETENKALCEALSRALNTTLSFQLTNNFYTPINF